MSYKTTAILGALVAVVGLGWIGFSFVGSSPSAPPPVILDAEMKTELTADKASRPEHITLKYADQPVELERKAGQKDWTMPGNWPTRSYEVARLIRVLTGLESRYVPVPLTEKNKPKMGLDKPAVTVTLQVGDRKQVLEFGRPVPGATFEDADEPGNSFYQPTFLRLDGKDEAIRLAPGLVDALRRPADYYLQRWLFLPPEKQIRNEDSPAKSDRFEVVKSITISRRAGKDQGYTLAWNGSSWELSQPARDRVDPNQLKTILEAVPDIWAERFENKPKKDLAEYGLKDPEESLRVTLDDGRTVTVLVGKKSRVDRRIVMQPSPPFGPPQQPRARVIEEAFRYAKLQDPGRPTNQIFEIKADKLKALLVPASTLRDSRLARFRSDDAREVEVTWKGKKIVLAKEKETWHITQPTRSEADTTKVRELLDKLSNLEARGPDVIDKGDPATYGLAKPEGEIKVTVEEKGKGPEAEKAKKTKVFRFALGKHDAAKAKLYVKVDDWPRINAVEDGLAKLAGRDVLAYRGRKVLQVAQADLSRVDVQRPVDPFTLEQTKGGWRLKAPVQADVDLIKVDQLVGDLSQLEAVEFVADNPKPADLEKQYGLGPSALAVRFTFTDAKKKPQVVLLGKRRPGKEEYFAKLDSSPAVFTVRKLTYEAAARPSLEYRPTELWFMPAEEIGELRIQKQEEYRLVKDGAKWRVAGPFEAPAVPALVQPMTRELSGPRCERYEVHFTKDLAKYGLDKPYLRVAVVPAVKKNKKAEAKTEEEGPKERVLLIGSPVKPGAKDRFAKLGDGEAVFVLGEKTVAVLDHGPLELLDRSLLSLLPGEVQRVQTAGGKGPITLERKGSGWQVSQSPAGAFPADREAADALADRLAHLEAAKFADYGPKVDPAKYGLKTPAVTLTVTRQLPDKKTKQHTVALGAEVPRSKGERYARVDQGPGVAVLDAATVRQLMPTSLDLVNRSPWKAEASVVTGLERRQGKEILALVRKGDGWEILQPVKQPADKPTLDGLVAQLANLRAAGVAAYPAGALKHYGLDQPLAVVKLRLSGVEHVLQIGGLHEEGDARGSGERYALVDKSTTVYILPGELARQLTAPSLQFRDRTVAHLTGVDRVEVERGKRKAVFARKNGAWKMTGPVEAEAEQTDLEDFLKTLGSLRADQLVAEKPADLKIYGLDHPQAAWHFYAGDKEVLGLLIGAPEKIKQGGKETDGPRCYAKLTQGDLVFLLDPRATDLALGEYRSRTVWPVPPDAAQVTEVRFGYRQNPFTLTMVNNAWQVAGKPEAKVDSAKVRDTLAALSGLRALRYVEDKGTNLNLYGLDPAMPELVLEVTLPTGKKVLHVGHAEGGSKRYYARVPDRPDAPVFVLSEADAGRLVRTLKDFTPKPTK